MTVTDKSRQLNVSLQLLDQGVHFSGITDGTHPPVSIDYIPPLGNNLGYTSLELLLMSFGTCVGSTLIPLLKRAGRTITDVKMDVTGERNQQHPTSFSVITLDIVITSPDVTEEEFDRTIAVAEEKICPVWAMIKGNVQVIVKKRIDRS